LPLIATNKLLSEKGFFGGTETERLQTLIEAAKNGFAYVDFDLSNPKLQETIQKLHDYSALPIVSYHKFDGPLGFSDMENVLKQQISVGASVCKIVTTANKVDDNLSLLRFVSEMADKTNLVCFCMGEVGKMSRLLSPIFGAFFTFTSLESGSETALGQVPVQDMRMIYDLLGA